MTTFLKHSLPALLLLVSFAGNAAAQTGTRSSTDAAKAPQASPAESMDAEPTKEPIKAGAPEGNGKWVPRVDKNTCPNGSEAYIDEANGGVKCWVNTN